MPTGYKLVAQKIDTKQKINAILPRHKNGVHAKDNFRVFSTFKVSISQARQTFFIAPSIARERQKTEGVSDASLDFKT
jgi:hypothetical protein